MLIICDLSYRKNSLSYYEYVKPIEEIAKKSGIDFKTVHYTELLCDSLLKNSDNPIQKSPKGLILCGTALKDNKFLEDAEKFGFISNLNIPVLGICAGAQVIAVIFGGVIEENKQLGMTAVKKVSDSAVLNGMTEFDAYELHRNSVIISSDFEILAESDSGTAAFKHREKLIFGVMFHPEVRNERVVQNFLGIIQRAGEPV